MQIMIQRTTIPVLPSNAVVILIEVGNRQEQELLQLDKFYADVDSKQEKASPYSSSTVNCD
jgi:hypothetical protein